MDSTRPRPPVLVSPSLVESRPPSRVTVSLLPASLTGQNRLLAVLGLGYMVALVIAEGCTRLAPDLGFLPYGAVLLLLLLHTVLCWNHPLRTLPLILSLAPVARMALLLIKPAPASLYPALALGLPIAGAGAALLFPQILPRRRGKRSTRPRQDSRRAPRACFAFYLALVRRRSWGSYNRPRFSRAALLAVALLLLLLPGSRLIPSPGARAIAVSGKDDWLPLVSGPSLWAAGVSPLATAVAVRVLPPLLLRPPSFRSDVWGLYRSEFPEHSRPAQAGHQPLAVNPPPSVTWEESNATAWRRATTPEDNPPPDQEGLSAPPPPAVPEYPPECPATGYDNLYPRGVCTWYAKEKRPDLPWFYWDYGLALNWPLAAELCGFQVDQEPAVGAVIVFPPGANGAYDGGHVGYVEEVSEDSVLISECNVTHDASYSLEPWWWEGGYPCAFRRISFSWLDSRVQFIHSRLGER